MEEDLDFAESSETNTRAHRRFIRKTFKEIDKYGKLETGEMLLKQVRVTDMISFVQLHPAIWDRSCTEYKDRGAREIAWQEICKQIVPEYDNYDIMRRRELADHIMRKWYNVRDTYVKYRRGHVKNKKPYVYKDEMSFLDPVYVAADEETYTKHTERLKRRISKGEEKSKRAYRLTPEELEDPTLELLHSDEEDVTKVYLDVDAEGTQKNEEVINVLSSILNREEDEDRAFFSSIMPSVKSLSDDAKFTFRIEVMTLLKNLKKSDSKRVARMSFKIERVSSESEDE